MRNKVLTLRKGHILKIKGLVELDEFIMEAADAWGDLAKKNWV